MNALADTVKQMYAAFGERNWERLVSYLHEDVIWEAEGPAELKTSGIRHGKKEVLAFLRAVGEQYTDPSITLSEFVSSAESVATFGRYRATNKQTGKPVDSPACNLFQFRDGKVARFVSFSNHAALMEAAKP